MFFLLLPTLQDQKAQKEREIAALGYGRLPKSAMGKQLQQEAASLKRLEAAVLERLTEVSVYPGYGAMLPHPPEVHGLLPS
jgi:hypothetical protein